MPMVWPADTVFRKVELEVRASRQDQFHALCAADDFPGENKSQTTGAAGDQVDPTIFPWPLRFLPDYFHFTKVRHPAVSIMVSDQVLIRAPAVLR